MKKFLLLVAILSIIPVSAQARNFGFGLSANSDDASIYFPIELQEKFKVEPYFRWFKSTDKSNDFEGELKQYEFGFGIFYNFNIKESYAVYSGSRFAYINRETNSDFIAFDGQLLNQSNELDGFKISPTLGFEYFFTNNISLAGEVEWFYQKFDQKDNDPFEGVTRKTDTSQNGTDSRVLLRFYF
jgi:hypothetical protein